MILAARILVFGAAVSHLLAAQAPVFEVASVKPAVAPPIQPIFCLVPCAVGERTTVSGSRIDIRYTSLLNLIVTAYRVKPYEVSGPEWMQNERFDIAATIPAGLSQAKLPEMLQALLADRFKLSIHRDMKELPVYAVVVGRSGAKLQQAAADAAVAWPDPAKSTELYTPQGDARMLEGGGFVIKDGPFGPIRSGRGGNGRMQFEFLRLTMSGLAEILTPHFDRPVVDHTNLTGAYHVLAENRAPENGGRKTGPDEGRSSGDNLDGPPLDPFTQGLYAAMDKAGLKLEKVKAPVGVIIVDHVERTPTGN